MLMQFDFGVNSVGEIVKARTIEDASNVAGAYASQSVFADYQSRKSENTKASQLRDLACFADYLALFGVQDAPSAESLYS